MNNKEFRKLLEERTKKLTISILKMSSLLPNTPEGNMIRHQICRSSASIGANYREANRARSLADFRNKIGICEGEASETVYWLEIILESELFNIKTAKEMLIETNEILAIFTTIGKNTKRK